MVTKLTLQQIIDILQKKPEQPLFDWKRDLCVNKKHEFVKDISAIANSTVRNDGYIFYGVDPNQKNSLIGIKESIDDAQLHQIVNSNVKPEIRFVYYEVESDFRKIGVVHIPVSIMKPHIICRDYKNLREGQMFIRRGSSTRGINFSDLINIFYSLDNPHFRAILRQYDRYVAEMRIRMDYDKLLKEEIQSLRE